MVRPVADATTAAFSPLLVGVLSETIRAITIYCKAHFFQSPTGRGAQ